MLRYSHKEISVSSTVSPPTIIFQVKLRRIVTVAEAGVYP